MTTPPSLHNALRRVIATTADPDDAAPCAGKVTCLRFGACSDSNGHHPVGAMDVSRLTGDPLIRWNDGLVAP